MKLNVPETTLPRIVIVGAGFAGLKLARKLNNNKFQVVLIDKNNYHQFQPLFYQVATAGLEASSISFPLRQIFQHHPGFHVRMTMLTGIKPSDNIIETSGGILHYDYLVLCTGLDTNFYGLENVRKNALPMKTVVEAVELRNAILENYENALTSNDTNEQLGRMSIAIVGGGATGVELAGSLAEMKKYILPGDYPELNFDNARIYLIEASDKILSSFSETLSGVATRYLKKLGVELLLNTAVKDYDGKTLTFSDEKQLHIATLIWTAGVKAFPIQGFPQETYGAGGRFKVDRVNKLSDHKNIFALGDVALMVTPKYPKGHPQVAQVAIQQARHLAHNFNKRIKDLRFHEFEYRDAGSMATIGKNKAVVQLPLMRFRGFIAWLVWMFIHLMAIVGVKNRLQIFINWAWSYLTYNKSFRLIYTFNNKEKTSK